MAAASSQLKETECAVCTNDFTTPKILSCGHVLCRECVITWVNLKSEASCPLCKCPILHPQGHSGLSSSDIADSLPTDFAIEALVDSGGAALSRNSVCCGCGDIKAEFICMQCRDVLCSACCKVHTNIPGTPSHNVESLSAVPPERLAASRPVLCADHKDKQADLFCADHGIPVCASCANVKHKSCAKVNDIDKEMKSAGESMKRLIDILHKVERELEQSIAEVDKRLQEVSVREQLDMSEVDKVCRHLHKLVLDFRNNMKEKCRNSHSEVKKSFDVVKTSLEQRLAMVASHKRIMSRTVTTAPRPALINATIALQDRVTSLDLTADLNVHVWGDPLPHGTRCHDIIRPIEKQLQTAGKRSKHLKEIISAKPQTFWLQWTEAAFPDLDSRAYFLAPVHINHVTTGQSSDDQPPPVHDSDVRDDAALKQVLCCLQNMSEQNGEVFVGMSQLQFGQYQGQPCYSAAVACLLESSNLVPALSRNLSAGDFDVLLIHRHYGLVAIEVKCFGASLDKRDMSQQELDNNIRSNIKDAVSQLAKAKTILSHLVSDIAPRVRITKTMVFPNLTARQVQQALSGDPQLTQDACWCLGTTDPADITGLCVCSDQLSDPKTPWDVSSDVLRELGNWWQRRVAVSGPDSHMTCDNYKKLVARFCGPATTVPVPLTGECYAAQITLFPEQVHLLNTAHPRVFVAGPPGTGKSVMLLLKATEWMRCGNDVHIVSSWCGSRAACSLLYHLLLMIAKTQLTSVVSPGKPCLLQYDFLLDERGVEKAVNDLSKAAKGQSLYIIADEILHQLGKSNFQTFCGNLLTQVPHLHLWAASCYHGYAPVGWHVEYLTRPLRSPPAVVREVQQDVKINEGRQVKKYRKRGVADHTDGPPVKRLYHRGQGHDGCLLNCVTCGRELASFLHSLRVPVDSKTSTNVSTINSSTTPPCIQWRDMLVLAQKIIGDQPGVVTVLREAGIPVRVMTDNDIVDVVTAHSDVVWAAREYRVRGLEKKVVVCLEAGNVLLEDRLHSMSRCTSQLVIVSPDQSTMTPKHS